MVCSAVRISDVPVMNHFADDVETGVDVLCPGAGSRVRRCVGSVYRALIASAETDGRNASSGESSLQKSPESSVGFVGRIG